MTYQQRTRTNRRRDDRDGDSHYDKLQTGMILDKLDQVAQDVAKMATRFDSLPESFITRREYQAEMTAMRERQSDQHSRLTAVEEWRLSETQRAAAQQNNVQQQVSNVSVSEAEKRERLMTAGLTVMGSAVIALLGIILQYLIHH